MKNRVSLIILIFTLILISFFIFINESFASEYTWWSGLSNISYRDGKFKVTNYMDLERKVPC